MFSVRDRNPIITHYALRITHYTRNHPLIPPRATPLMMDFRAKRNRIIIGKTTTVDAAMSSSGREPASVVNAYNPKGNVRLAVVFITSRGHINEFHATRAFNNMIVTKEGLAMGTMILHKYSQLLAPSTRAEKYRLSGTDMKKLRKIYV